MASATPAPAGGSRPRTADGIGNGAQPGLGRRRILPYPNTAARLPELIKDLKFVTVEGGPHNIAWTHPEVVNPALLDFLAEK